jgi:hypothetical protein
MTRDASGSGAAASDGEQWRFVGITRQRIPSLSFERDLLWKIASITRSKGEGERRRASTLTPPRCSGGACSTAGRGEAAAWQVPEAC